MESVAEKVLLLAGRSWQEAGHHGEVTDPLVGTRVLGMCPTTAPEPRHWPEQMWEDGECCHREVHKNRE